MINALKALAFAAIFSSQLSQLCADEEPQSKIETGRYTDLSAAHFLPLGTEVIMLGVLEKDDAGQLYYSHRRGAPDEALTLIVGLSEADKRLFERYVGKSGLFRV